MRKPRIAVVGGGFGGLEAAFYLRDRVGHRAEITLVSSSKNFLFKPNTIYIPFGRAPEQYIFPIARPLSGRGIPFVHAWAEAVDLGARRIFTDQGDIPFDYAILATGAGVRPEELPGLSEHAHTVWNPEEMLRLREAFARLVTRAEENHAARVLFLVPPNNPCSGPLYEMALMLDTWLTRERVRPKIGLSFATHEATYLEAFGPRMHEVIAEEFERRGIEGRSSAVALRIEGAEVAFEGRGAMDYDLLVASPAQVAAARFSSLESDARGFVRVETRTRQVVGQPDIYAVGDASDFPVKQAYLTLLQADAAAEHLSQRLLGLPAEAAFDPVSLFILEAFDRAAFAQVPLTVTGDPERPVAVADDRRDEYRVAVGKVWRMGKSMLGRMVPAHFQQGRPFHAGKTWRGLEAGLRAMSHTFAE